MFFALWPDDDVRAALDALARDYAGATGGRAPAAANLHLTLAFVGEVAASRVATAAGDRRQRAARVAPFTLTLDRIGAFHKQGIAWIGTVDAPDPKLEAARATHLADSLRTPDSSSSSRAFHPHVTLARRGADATALMPRAAASRWRRRSSGTWR